MCSECDDKGGVSSGTHVTSHSLLRLLPNGSTTEKASKESKESLGHDLPSNRITILENQVAALTTQVSELSLQLSDIVNLLRKSAATEYVLCTRRLKQT